MKEIIIEDFSNLRAEIKINKKRTILLARFKGVYRKGSQGNGDGLFMLSKIAAVYFMFESISALVLDLTSLTYEWGNTIDKSLTFFDEIGRDESEMEKKVVIVPSSSNKAAIVGLLSSMGNKSAIIVNGIDEALAVAENEASKYLDL